MPPISLSDSELAAIMDACRPLQPRDRDRFLKDIAAELAALPMLGDGVVHRAIVTIQRRSERHLRPSLQQHRNPAACC
jgi:hypothetical protein